MRLRLFRRLRGSGTPQSVRGRSRRLFPLDVLLSGSSTAQPPASVFPPFSRLSNIPRCGKHTLVSPFPCRRAPGCFHTWARANGAAVRAVCEIPVYTCPSVLGLYLGWPCRLASPGCSGLSGEPPCCWPQRPHQVPPVLTNACYHPLFDSSSTSAGERPPGASDSHFPDD